MNPDLITMMAICNISVGKWYKTDKDENIEFLVFLYTLLALFARPFGQKITNFEPFCPAPWAKNISHGHQIEDFI